MNGGGIMTKLSAVIITRNEELNIGRCLDSLSPVADDIVVVDSFSTDRTREICMAREGVRFIEHTFVDYGKQKQFAIEQAEHSWVLSIDADEYLTPGLQAEIAKLKEQGMQGGGYMLRRRTIYQGRELHFCGMRSERHLRLFDRTCGSFSDAAVHEKFQTKLPVSTLRGKLMHMPYRDLQHHLQKIDYYTTLYADSHAAKRRVSALAVFMRSPLRFLTIYIVKLAILDGYAGFVWASMGAWYSWLKLAKLREVNKKTD